MDALQQRVTQAVEGKIDFEGQKLVEQVGKYSLLAITIVSFIVGLVLQSLRVTFGLFGASTVLLSLVVVPPWPMFNRHPVQWLPSKEKKPSS